MAAEGFDLGTAPSSEGGGFLEDRRFLKDFQDLYRYYKDTKLLMPFVPERAKILPRRISGTCALHQRKLRTAIMRARQLALIPYTSE